MTDTVTIKAGKKVLVNLGNYENQEIIVEQEKVLTCTEFDDFDAVVSKGYESLFHLIDTILVIRISILKRAKGLPHTKAAVAKQYGLE